MVKNRLCGRILFFIVSLFTLVAVSAEDTQTGIFDSTFKTLQLSVNGNYFQPPIININTDDYLTVEFDEIAENRRYLRYSLQHCNADWTPSLLVEPEFTEGFNLANIEDYDFSQTTLTHYVHYWFLFPNPDLKITKSGNYLIKIFDESDPDNVLLQARFYASEAVAATSAEITSRTDIDYNKSHQQLSLGVDCTKAGVQNVFTDLKVHVMQNCREDNAVTLTSPTRVVARKVYFEHLKQLIFPAGNEYRRFENISVHFPGMRVDNVEYHHPYYHARLFTDYQRSLDQYVYDSTQFGRFFIREYNSEQSNIEAEYVVVHFALEAPHYPDYDIYLDGDFLQHKFSPESIMTYNRATDCYEKTLLLKQGAYNYQYLAVKNGVGHTDIVEGDNYQTVNEYTILVYNRNPGERYDRLISAAVAYSDK